jgi:Protein of unknown function (DUF1588)/Protein of unknown function (DUF1592)/Protein of unknown function (DUF1585)/Protein of unknown function (DUF1587)/Protein of unknown function (DUF1595)
MPSAPPPAAGVTECKNPDLIGATPIRRISTEEYTNAVRDVFQVVVDVGQLPADEKLGIFKTNVATRITADHFERYQTLASNAADDVVANFAALSGCADTADTACATGYLQKAARRLFHGTLEAADSTRLDDLYTSLASTDANVALSTAVQWTLLSPRFLFLVEFGQSAGAERSELNGSEVAGRLAAFFWRTVPDEAMLTAADAGSFDSPAGVRTQADAMLSDARSTPMLKSFGQQLLRIVPAAPDATALDQLKMTEVGEIFAHASTDATLSFASLITGANPTPATELDAFYGDEDRRGVLLTAGFLSSNSTGTRASTTKRGNTVRSSLLCGVVPPPTDPTVAQLMETGETSDQKAFDAHSDIPECQACHQLMDPIGNAFAQYGANGAFDMGLATDTSGTIAPLDETGAGDFSDINGLLTLIANDPSATECFALQATRFALGRNETVDDGCGVKEITDAFTAASYSVRELLLSIASSSAFTSRNTVVPGGQCR